MAVKAIERAAGLLEDPPPDPDTSRGYLDLLVDRDIERRGAAHALMRTTVIPRISRRWWRPAAGRLVKGFSGPSMAREFELVREALHLAAGDTVLDVGCGPGNFTSGLGALVGDGGLAVGVDASPTMLATAVREACGRSVAYVRGDAVRLPFVAGAFDAVCCIAALNLFAEPFAALDHMLRVLAPGGRIAVLATVRVDAGIPRVLGTAAARVAGVHLFEPAAIPGALAERGAHRIRQQTFGVMQFVSAQTRVAAA